MSIRVEGITKRYGGQKALDNVSFSISSDEIVGFLGPNGAGKSTMMKIITGSLPATAGSVYIDDVEVTCDTVSVRQNIGYLPEHNPLYHDMYVCEYLLHVAGIYKMAQKKQHVKEMLEMTGLISEQHKKIGNLSKGYKQRVGVAQALIHNPGIVILDEPTSGLDPKQLIEIRQLIKQISSKKTVLFSTHIMQEVEALCDRVIIVDKGKIVADKTSEQMKYVYSGLAQAVFVEFASPVDKKLLLSIPGVEKADKMGGTQWILLGNEEEDMRPNIFKFAVEKDKILLTLRREEASMENVFINATSMGRG